MKSTIGVKCEKYRRHTDQFVSEPSPTNALRVAAMKPAAMPPRPTAAERLDRFSRGHHAPHQHFRPARRFADADVSADSSFVGESPTAEKPLISREICPIRRGSTKISGIVDKDRPRTFHSSSQQAAHFCLAPKTTLRDSLSSCSGGAASLRLRIWIASTVRLHAPLPAELARATALLFRQHQRLHAASSAFRSAMRFLADPFRGPRNPLLGNVQLRHKPSCLFQPDENSWRTSPRTPSFSNTRGLIVSSGAIPRACD